MFSRDPMGSALITESLNPPATLAQTASATAPSLLDVLRAPFRAIRRPSAAARTLAATRPAAFWAVFLPQCLAFGVALACIPILVEMFDSIREVETFANAWRKVDRGRPVGPV